VSIHRGHAVPFQGRSRVALLLLLILSAGTGSLARGRTPGPCPHKADSECGLCHSVGRGALEKDRAGARTALRPDLEAVCESCHGGEGASHRTHITAPARAPDQLPLSSGRTVECYTCHFIHGESRSSDSYVRIDNRRGGLCLSCHTMAELEKQ
jgi:predicted CXXCH cytochrome family protein